MFNLTNNEYECELFTLKTCWMVSLSIYMSCLVCVNIVFVISSLHFSVLGE